MLRSGLYDVFEEKKNVFEPFQYICVLFDALVKLILVEVYEFEGKFPVIFFIEGYEQRWTREIDPSEQFEICYHFVQLLNDIFQQFDIDCLSIKEKQGQVLLNLIFGYLLPKIFTDETLFISFSVVKVHNHAVDSEVMTIGGRLCKFDVALFEFFPT